MRDLPRQKRSRVLVESILEAAARLLPERGVEGATTNHIARLAGVSIGSLYRYFDDRDSILTAIIVRDLEFEERVYTEIIRGHRDAPLDELIVTLVEHATERFGSRAEILRRLLVHLPRLEQVGRAQRVRRGVIEAMAESLVEHDRYESLHEAERASWTLLNAIMGVYQAWVLAPREERFAPEDLNRQVVSLARGMLR